MFSRLRLILNGENGIFCALSPDRSKATQPATLGELIDVPFISRAFLSVQFGTDVMAPPGAQTETPKSPFSLKIFQY